MAIHVYNALSTDDGGVDWSGLQLHVELFGISDVEGLMHRIHVIKTHSPPKAPSFQAQ